MTIRKSKDSSNDRLERQLLGARMSMGKALAGLRHLHGLTQTALARKIGMSRQHVCDIEKGRRFVSAAKAAEIARRLGHPEAYFVRLALQDAVSQDGLSYRVVLHAA